MSATSKDTPDLSHLTRWQQGRRRRRFMVQKVTGVLYALIAATVIAYFVTVFGMLRPYLFTS